MQSTSWTQTFGKPEPLYVRGLSSPPGQGGRPNRPQTHATATYRLCHAATRSAYIHSLRPQLQHKRVHCHATPLSSTSRSSIDITLRQGTSTDLPIIAAAVIKEWLNPVGLDPTRFVVATTKGPQNQEVVMGWGQLKPRDPAPGVVAGGGKCWEVGSLVTQREYRRRGVASAVMRALLSRVSPNDLVYVMTTTSKVKFYERLGFKLLSKEKRNMSGSMALEFGVGQLVVLALNRNQELVLMEARPGSQ